MRFEDKERSENLEDRRAEGGGLPSGFPGRASGPRIGLPLPRGRNGRVSVTGLIVMLVVMYFLGINPLSLLGGAGMDGAGLGGGERPLLDGGRRSGRGLPGRQSGRCTHRDHVR